MEKFTDEEIKEILKTRPCGKGNECADWHGLCPEAVEQALESHRTMLRQKWEKEKNMAEKVAYTKGMKEIADML